MKQNNSTKILDRTPSSIPVRIKPDGTINLPKSWIKDILEESVLATKIDNVLIITPQKVQPDYSIDEKIWRKIEPTLRRIRKQIFKEKYPQLYASLKRKKKF